MLRRVLQTTGLRLIFFGMLCFSLKSGLFAQTSESTPATTLPKPAETITLERTPHDAVLLYGPSGHHTVVLPGPWSLETFDDFADYLLQNQRPQESSCTIQEIKAKGSVVDSRAEIEVIYSLTTSTLEDEPIRVPLGMKEGVLPVSSTETPRARYNGPGRFELSVQPSDGQYVAILHKNTPKSGGTPAPVQADGKVVPSQSVKHEISVNFWLSLSTTNDESNRLAFTLPPSVSTQLTLTVPVPNAAATLSAGALVFSEESHQQSTTFVIHGLRSSFEMNWRKKKVERADERPILDVEDASIVAQIEDLFTLYDLTLPVRTLTVPFDQFHVMLPPGTALDRDNSERYAITGDYTIRELSAEEVTQLKKSPKINTNKQSRIPDFSDTENGVTILEVSLPRKTTGPVNIRLKATQQFSAAAESGGDRGYWRDLSGFDVLEAERQYGFLSVSIPSGMRPNWKSVEGIRRVDLPSTFTGVAARFEIFSQPFLLRTHIGTPQTRINVFPEYQIGVGKNALTLLARLTFDVKGAKTDQIQMVLPNWNWVEINSQGSIVDIDGIEQDANDLLTIPLRTAVEGSFFIDLRATQPLTPLSDADRRRLIVTLPQLVTNWSEPASVVIVPDDNIELIPIVSPNEMASESVAPVANPSDPIMKGLVRKNRRSLSLRLDIPSRQQEPLVYQSESASPVFVADAIHHHQKVSASVQSEIRLTAAQEQVSETISYKVRYEPIDRLVLAVPKELSVGRVRFLLSGKQLDAKEVYRERNGGSDQFQWYQIMLPEMKMGDFQLIAHFSIDPVTPSRDRTTVVSIPFILPEEVELTEQTATFLSLPGLRLEIHDKAKQLWKNAEWYGGGRFSEASHLVAVTKESSLPVSISSDEPDTWGPTMIERLWMQTWLSEKSRVDHLRFIEIGEKDTLICYLPPEVNRSRIAVKRDSELISILLGSKGELILPKSLNRNGQPVKWDILYQIDAPDTLTKTDHLEVIRFSDDTLVRYVYFQVILPQNRHLLNASSSLTPEYYWRWQGLFFSRTPSVRYENVGFDSSPNDLLTVPTEANQYLFSCVGLPDHISLTLWNRTFIVLVCSGISLFIGLVLIYVPQSRYAGSVLSILIALLAVLFFRPTPILLLLQASSAGVFIAFGTLYLYRIVYHQDPWVIEHEQSKANIQETRAPEQLYPVIMDDSESTSLRKENGKQEVDPRQIPPSEPPAIPPDVPF